ncbi:hypothetical protein ACOSP7_021559 [Xanthoceras sorbifolium]
MAAESRSMIHKSDSMMALLPTLLQPPLIVKSMNFNIPIKLNRDNYIYWKALIMPVIRAIEFKDFIIGKRICPSKFVEVLSFNGVDKEITFNPDFSAWKRCDQFLLGWLLSTISENLIEEVTECVTSIDAWKTLASMFSQQFMAKLLQLKQQLQGLKKGLSSINEYLLKIKEITDGLRSVGQAVSDQDLLLNALNGLGQEYDSVVVLVSQHNYISFHEAQYMLMIFVQMIDHLNFSTQVEVTPSANFAVNNNAGNSAKFSNRGGPPNGGGRNNNNRGKRGRGRWNNSNRPTGQICSRVGHTVTQCYNIYDRNFNQAIPQSGFQTLQGVMQVHTQAGPFADSAHGFASHNGQHTYNPRNFQQYQAHYNLTSAYITSLEVVADPSWYVDNG